MSQSLNSHYAELKSEGWVGAAADAFFNEFETELEPALKRLYSALEDGGALARQIAQVLGAAEEEAANQFTFGEGESIYTDGASQPHTLPLPPDDYFDPSKNSPAPSIPAHPDIDYQGGIDPLEDDGSNNSSTEESTNVEPDYAVETTRVTLSDDEVQELIDALQMEVDQASTLEKIVNISEIIGFDIVELLATIGVPVAVPLAQLDENTGDLQNFIDALKEAAKAEGDEVVVTTGIDLSGWGISVNGESVVERSHLIIAIAKNTVDIHILKIKGKTYE